MTDTEIKEGLAELKELSKELDVMESKMDKKVGMPKHITKIEDKIKYMKEHEQSTKS